MTSHATDKYLDAIIHCLGAEDDSLFKMPDHERDELVSLNFENSYKGRIMRNINRVVLPDNRLTAR